MWNHKIFIGASDGDIKLIDFNATVRVGKDLTNKKKSTANISPEVAKVGFYVTESLDNLVKLKNKRLEERILLEEEGDDGFDEIAEEIRKLKGNIKMIKNNSTTQEGLKASKTMDI